MRLHMASFNARSHAWPLLPMSQAKRRLSSGDGSSAHELGRDHLSELAREADIRLCSIHRVVEALRDGVESTRHVGTVIDMGHLEMRAQYISAMRSIQGELRNLVETVDRHRAAAEAMHNGEIQTVQKSLSRASTEIYEGHAPEPGRSATLKIQAVGVSAQHSELKSATARSQPWAMSRSSIQIAGGIGLDAICVPRELSSVADIMATILPGEIHYIPQWQHFATKLGGIIFHANVGRIYPMRHPLRGKSATPERIKNCRKVQCSRDGCQFFHDPETCPGSSDVRNFVADSWLYHPSTEPSRPSARRFGSIEFLEADLRAMSEEEASRFLHQTAHDIVCSLILHKFVLKSLADGPR
jgi:hypothetical protein